MMINSLKAQLLLFLLIVGCNSCIAQLIIGKGIIPNIDSIYKHGDFYSLANIMSESDSIDFLNCITDKNIKFYADHETVMLKQSLGQTSILILRLYNKPAVVAPCFVFVYDRDSHIAAYTNSDTLLIDSRSQLPFILISSFKAKTFARRSNFAHAKTYNVEEQLLWENYILNDCDILASNHFEIKRRERKTYLQFILSNECGKKAKQINKLIRD